MQIPLQFTVFPDQVGDVYVTEFKFVSDLPSEYTNLAWDFGDGNSEYNATTATHVYQYPGLYTVGLSAWTNSGSLITDSASLNVDYVLRDSLVFEKFSDSYYGTPGIRSPIAFTVNVISSKIDTPLALSFQSLNSKSVPHYSVPEKWSFITPTWRFTDAKTNKIIEEHLELDTVPIYKDSVQVAVSAQALFYYTDDMSSGGINSNNFCPLLLVVTLSTENFVYPPESLAYPYFSYSNSEVTRAVVDWQVTNVVPTELKITENFINNIYPVKWANVPIPIMITCKFDASGVPGMEHITTGVADVLSYPKTNALGEFSPVDVKIPGLSESLYVVGEDVMTGTYEQHSINPFTVNVSCNNHGRNVGDLIRVTITSGLGSSGYHFVTEATTHTFKYAASSPQITSGNILITSPLYFKAVDEYNNVASGYVFTTVTLLSSVETDLTLTASTVVMDDGSSDPIGVPIYTNVYVSHPEKSVINRIGTLPFPTVELPNGETEEAVYNCLKPTASTCANVEYFKSLGVIGDESLLLVPVPPLSVVNMVNYELSGTAAVYGMAFSPLQNKLYTCDSDQNTVSSFLGGKTLLSSVLIPGAATNDVMAPSYMSVDKFGNVWVSLYDNHKILKFDSNLNYLLSAIPTNTIPIDSYNAEEGSFFISPPVAETDKDSNVWSCYSHPASSALVKFSSTGTELVKATSLSVSSAPVYLAIDSGNNVWVACYKGNVVQKFSSNGTLMQTVTGFIHPTYVAVDRSDNVWITHGYDLCSVYNNTTNKLNTWKFSSKPISVTAVLSGYTATDIADAMDENEIWGGLATDVFDTVWAIDSENNTAFSFSPSNPATTYRTVSILPAADKAYITVSDNSYTSVVPAGASRSAQAAGDWTGNRWYQKYANIKPSGPIAGTSTPFKVYDLDNSYQLTKVNEEFDTAGYYKNLALPEILSQNTHLFDEFFSAVAGDGNPTKEDAGRVIYERIANFVAAHGDFETADVNQLVSFADQMAVETKTFGNNFPAEITRLLNICSIPRHLLRGIPNLEADVTNNVGPVLTETSTITANQYLFIKDRRYDTYQLLYVNALSGGVTSYPLSQIEAEGLRIPLVDNYYVFEYNNENSNGYVGNIINWDSDFTTFGYSLSTNEEWYGNDGIVETLFNILLTKRLFER